jgi:hypothetical protein
MFTCKKAPLAAAVAVIVGLAGCGGSGDSASPTPAKVPTAGSMVDGYVSGATVYCDVNGNGVGDSTEAKTTTDASGNYKFDDCNSAVVGSGGTDVTTGFPFTGVLKSPAGSAFMTPLTTLITGTGLTTAQLAKLLGLPEGTDPTKVDPTKDVNILKTTLAVQQIMAQLAATIQAAGGGDLGAIYSKVASSLADTLKSAPAGTTLISGSGLNVDLLVSAAKAAAGSAIDTANITAVVSDISSQSTKYLTATSLDSLSSLAKALQDPAVKVNPSAGTKFFALHNDSILFGGQPYTLTDLGSASGITLTSFDKIGLQVDVTGAPTVGTSAVALSMVEQGGSGRAMQVMLDKVNFTLASGQLSMAVASDAKVYLYGKKANGATVTFTGPLGTILKPVTVSNNTLTLDYSAMVKKALETSTAANEPTLQSFLNVTGTFQVTAAISNFNLRKSNASALEQSVVSVTGTDGKVAGVGFTGKVTVLAN